MSTSAVATVQIVDNCGNAIASARVTGAFSGSAAGGGTKTTDAAGTATFTSGTTGGPGSRYRFCVSDVSGTLSYDSSSNVESCDDL